MKLQDLLASIETDEGDSGNDIESSVNTKQKTTGKEPSVKTKKKVTGFDNVKKDIMKKGGYNEETARKIAAVSGWKYHPEKMRRG